MAVWSQADIEKLKAAVLALACGEAVQSVSYDGPPRRTVTYQASDLGKLREMLADMLQEQAQAAGRVMCRIARVRKGV